ncbi:MAG: putative metal-binding motif-containing protein [Myxococcota bacterium]
MTDRRGDCKTGGGGTAGRVSAGASPHVPRGPAPDDCDDSDPERFPGADERCDGVDQDCDGAIDEDALDGSMVADARPVTPRRSPATGRAEDRRRSSP